MKYARTLIAFAGVAVALIVAAPAGAAASIKMQPKSIPGGPVGQFYSQTISATGGVGPYTFTVVKGSLPDGLMLSSDGTLSGTPTTNQTKTFTVQAADSESPAATARVGYTVTFGIVFTTGSLPTASIGSPYSAGPLQVKGGTAPYQFSVVGGATPPGITLDPSGTLSGTPESLGSYQFTVQVSDSGSPQQSNTKSYTVRVTPVGQWTLCGQSNLPNGGGTGIDGVTLSPGGTMSDSDGTSGSWSTRGNHITMAFGIRNYQGTWNSSLNQYQGTYNGADSGTFAMAPGGLSNGQDCVQP